ncbi:hypothetical protein [Priestia endophytica]|uniref:hypothetical protein n=1 Tax=Priestia endophytica TaxID=135735 RepID=UPI00228226D0|nr:hypothetical protein [Priestia endophytica]MCY8234819.1 hypothetical protein [Priestia endophytica]
MQSIQILGYSWITTIDKRIYGSGSDDLDKGRLVLKSTRKGGTANGLVPYMSLNNYTDTNSTNRSSVIVQTGRDNAVPNSDSRFGFEVWQYKGDGAGGNNQLVKVDTNSSSETYAGIYTDKAWLPQTNMKAANGSYYTPLLTSVGTELTNLYGARNGSSVMHFGDTDMTIT